MLYCFNILGTKEAREGFCIVGSNEVCFITKKSKKNQPIKLCTNKRIYFHHVLVVPQIRTSEQSNMSKLSQTKTTETEKKDNVKDFHTDPLLPGEKIHFFRGEALKGGQKIEVSPPTSWELVLSVRQDR